MSANLGNKIKQLRKKEGYTLEGLAGKIGAGKSYLWELENKGVKKPSAERITKLASALKVTPEYLVNDKAKKPNPDVTDEAFYREYLQLDKKTKEQLRNIMTALKNNIS